MGNYLNPPPQGFRESLDSQIYVDKSVLIAETNKVIGTQQKYLCVSRPRRFGKSMALSMLAAYYSRARDTHDMFDGLEISRMDGYEKRINDYDVIFVNMQEFVSMAEDIDDCLDMLQSELLAEMEEIFHTGKNNLVLAMKTVFSKTGNRFVILIDEWDCLFREYRDDEEAQRRYLDFLRLWLKDQPYVALAYMTGILPVKKYGTHSALNMFSEYSMTQPGALAPYFGFTEGEVRALCAEYGMSFEEVQAWYDGYELASGRGADDRVGTRAGDGARDGAGARARDGGGIDAGAGDPDARAACSIYSPRSIVESMRTGAFGSYWNQTETYEALKVYIQLNVDGLKDAVVEMMAGASVRINTGTFANDMKTFSSKDDVLTLLVHLGYLSYRAGDGTVVIPNREVAQEYRNAISTMDWSEVARAVEDSRRLLDALIAGDGDAVAKGVDRAHEEISILAYNDENSLSCCIHLAFYCAREYYTVVRELPSGRGFADVVLIPRRRYADKPAVVIELKCDAGARGAIAQIRERRYCRALADYRGSLLLAGIVYDKRTKRHSCTIEAADWG